MLLFILLFLFELNDRKWEDEGKGYEIRASVVVLLSFEAIVSFVTFVISPLKQIKFMFDDDAAAAVVAVVVFVCL